jgi:hypothetical protein
MELDSLFLKLKELSDTVWDVEQEERSAKESPQETSTSPSPRKPVQNPPSAPQNRQNPSIRITKTASHALQTGHQHEDLDYNNVQDGANHDDDFQDASNE